MRRPAGVIISCIVLGFAALMLLLSAAGSLLAILVVGHMPATPGYGGQPAPPPAMMNAIFIILSLLYAALAAWAIATVVGLARMRSWARYSIIVIGCGLALIGVFGALSMIAAQAMIAKMPMPPGTDAGHMRIVMVIGGVFWLVFAAIGICWIVYFALRSTRDAFALSARPQVVPVAGYVAPPSPYAASSYEVASYIPDLDPNANPVTAHVVVLDQAVATTATPPGRPLAISIIAWLLIAGALFVLPFSLLPFPIFVFGIMMTGWAAHLAMLSFGVISLLAGIGLLRLEKIALYTAYAFYLFGIVNSGLILLPSVRDRMITYQADMMQKMSLGMPQPFVFDSRTMALMMIPGLVLGVAFCAALLVLLYINRAAFDRADARSTQAAAL